jgi:ABC-type phosphate transport system substrate-binding protein
MSRKLSHINSISTLSSIFLAGSLIIAPFSAKAEDLIKVIGSPGSIKTLESQSKMLESTTGKKIEFKEGDPTASMKALERGLVDAVALGGTAAEFFASADVKAAKIGSADDYQWLVFSESKVMAVLNPENPQTSLTHEQITKILSGSEKTWEAINGRKDAIHVVFNRTQISTVALVPKFYLGKTEVPNADYVTTKEGVIRRLKSDIGTISFSGSKFEGEGLKPRFIDTEIKVLYAVVVKKPLSAKAERLLAGLKK